MNNIVQNMLFVDTFFISFTIFGNTPHGASHPKLCDVWYQEQQKQTFLTWISHGQVALCIFTDIIAAWMMSHVWRTVTTCLAYQKYKPGITQPSLVWHFNGNYWDYRLWSVLWQNRFPLWFNIDFFLRWSGEKNLWEFTGNVAILLQHRTRSQEKFTKVCPDSKPPCERLLHLRIP